MTQAINPLASENAAEHNSAEASAPAGTYEVRTFGCQMNVHDSERLSGLLENSGYTPAAEGTDPDVLVFNTCAVRENADNRLYGTLAMSPALVGRWLVTAPSAIRKYGFASVTVTSTKSPGRIPSIGVKWIKRPSRARPDIRLVFSFFRPALA